MNTTIGPIPFKGGSDTPPSEGVSHPILSLLEKKKHGAISPIRRIGMFGNTDGRLHCISSNQTAR